MKYKALVSFSGLISMAEGEIRELKDENIINDLIKARFIISLDSPPSDDSKKSAHSSKLSSKKGGKKKDAN